MEHEKFKQGYSAAQNLTENIKHSEAVHQTLDKVEQAKNSEVYAQTRDSVQKQVHQIKDSSVVKNTTRKSVEVSRQVIETSKETYLNAKEKASIFASKTMTLATVVGECRSTSNRDTYEFLYYCKKVLNNFDPFEMIVYQAEEIAKNFNGYYADRLPYGRTLAFNRDFNPQLDAVAFFPEPSKDIQEMKEYGLLINTNSLVIKFQMNSSVNVFGRDINPTQSYDIEECIYFDRIENVKLDKHVLQIEYFNVEEQLKILRIHNKYKAEYFNILLKKLLSFACKFNYLEYSNLQNLNDDRLDNFKLTDLDVIKNKDYLQGGVNQSLSGNLSKNIDTIDFHYHEAKNYPASGGYYAEYLNGEVLNSLFTKVEVVAKSNPSQEHARGDNAADFKITNRFTGNSQLVQLKYYKDAKKLAKTIMEYDNPVMIPPDKYVETMKILKNDPEFKGKVNRKKLNSVKKGAIPYDLTISLNRSLPKKLGLDIGLSAKQSLTPALVTTGCSALISVWKGEDPKIAVKDSVKQGGGSFLISTAIGSTAKIAGRISATRLASKSAKGIKITDMGKVSQKTAKNVGTAATVALIAVSVVPDLTNAINGKISNQQLAKTLITTGAGLVGGAAGAGVGSIPLAIIASEATSQLFDKYVKDDVLVNYQIFKEVFIDLVNRYQLPLDDVNKLIDKTFANPRFNERLISLQIQCKNYNIAKYSIIYSELQSDIEIILSERSVIDEGALEILNEGVM